MRIDRPIAFDEVSRILSDPFDRMSFVREYKYFNKDGNAKEFNEYALSIVKSSREVVLVSDAILIALKTEKFSRPLFERIKRILFSRRHYLVKLACLEFLLAYRSNISKTSFIRINERILGYSRNSLLKVQAALNLVSLNMNAFETLFDLLNNSESPTEFYRVVNGLSQNQIDFDHNKVGLLRLIEEKPFRKEVKKELKDRLMKT